MLTLYEYAASMNCYKIRLLLAHLGLPYKRVEVDILKGESRTEAFLKRSPIGRIPVLALEDGRTLPESNAILAYLAEGTPFLPQDAFLRAQTFQWMFFEQNLHEPNVATVRFMVKILGLEGKMLEVIEDKRRRGRDALQVMDRHLAGKEFFVDGGQTIADMALYAYTHVADEGGFDLEDYPHVEAWMKRVSSSPGHTPASQ